MDTVYDDMADSAGRSRHENRDSGVVVEHEDDGHALYEEEGGGERHYPRDHFFPMSIEPSQQGKDTPRSVIIAEVSLSLKCYNILFWAKKTNAGVYYIFV